MAQARQKLKTDPAVIGSGIPMLSASEKPINAGDILYETELSETYNRSGDETDKYKLVITAHRVIQVNYQYRYVRIRCANACEMTIQYGQDKCSRTKYWHTVEDARKELTAKINNWVKTNDGEIANLESKAKHYQDLLKKVPSFNVVKIPADVKSPI